jgi:phosphate transport system permease protein
MRTRSVGDKFFWILCTVALGVIVAPAVSVLSSVFRQAGPVLGLSLLTEKTTDGSGLQNAILGTVLLLAGVLLVAGTVGVSAGVYLAEVASPRLAGALRLASELLSGMPSIVIGYVGYTSLVVGLHWQYSTLAAVLALSVLVIPYVTKTTEVALRSVPTSLREGAVGLGLTDSNILWRVVVPPAVPGIVSGLVIALAISTGETAPLLFTAGFSNQDPTLHLLHHQLGYLTGVTYTDVSLPGAHAHAMAAAAAAVTLVILVTLVGLGRALAARSRRATQGMTV